MITSRRPPRRPRSRRRTTGGAFDLESALERGVCQSDLTRSSNHSPTANVAYLRGTLRRLPGRPRPRAEQEHGLLPPRGRSRCGTFREACRVSTCTRAQWLHNVGGCFSAHLSRSVAEKNCRCDFCSHCLESKRNFNIDQGIDSRVNRKLQLRLLFFPFPSFVDHSRDILVALLASSSAAGPSSEAEWRLGCKRQSAEADRTDVLLVLCFTKKQFALSAPKLKISNEAGDAHVAAATGRATTPVSARSARLPAHRQLKHPLGYGESRCREAGIAAEARAHCNSSCRLYDRVSHLGRSHCVFEHELYRRPRRARCATFECFDNGVSSHAAAAVCSSSVYGARSLHSCGIVTEGAPCLDATGVIATLSRSHPAKS